MVDLTGLLQRKKGEDCRPLLREDSIEDGSQ